MLLKSKTQNTLTDRDVTPESLYMKRRTFLKSAGLIGAAGAVFAAGASNVFAQKDRTLKSLAGRPTGFTSDEALTPEEAVTNYNNFYEFGLGKGDPARNAWRLQVSPWTVTVDGMADRTGAYDLADLIDFNALEERIYRLRCVEAWSMVIPWIGIPLADVISKIEPQSGAKYVRFETLEDREQMPGLRSGVVEWPYVEGLRMDEALHPLAFLAVGLYGKELPSQNGAPLRLVVPWKYGFKSIKSIVRITLTDKRPRTTWEKSAPREYGFYANVNPQVDHPRWSQASERRIGEFRRRPTQMFNGYAEEIGDLYAGLDLRRNY